VSLSPSDFLAELRSQETVVVPPVHATPDYLKFHIAEMVRVGITAIDPQQWFDQFYSSLLEHIANALPIDTGSALLSEIAVGVVSDNKINACIVRHSDEHCYAILINRALVSVLTHYVKLIAAAQHPTDIAYFEGLLEPQLSAAIYTGVARRMLARYARSGEVAGPELKLKPNSDAALVVEVRLIAINMFVLAHEVGHYFNGDLLSDEHFSVGHGACDAQLFERHISYTMEFAADRFAFMIVLRLLSQVNPEMSAGLALYMSATLFFNILREISNKGSETHPQPSNRLLAVVHAFFGAEAADLFRKGFDDLSYYQAFGELVGSRSVADLLSTHFDQQLNTR
jgi:hypothetical protein